MKYGLKDDTMQKIRGVFTRFPAVTKAILYGSRAKGNFKSGSDIDLTLLGDSDLNLKELSEIISEMDDLLLPYTLDLSILSQISDQALREHIQRVGVIIYERNI